MKKICLIIIATIIGFTGYSQTESDNMMEGLIKMQKNDFEGAILEFTKAIEINPQFINAYLYRGGAKGELNDYRGAIADFTKAIVINPKSDDAYYLRGLAKSKFKHYKEAILDFSKAILINPKLKEAYFSRGFAKLKLGQKNSGCLDFSKAGELGDANAYQYINDYCNQNYYILNIWYIIFI